MTNSSTSSRGSSKREKILIEAVRQFNANGYFDTRLEDISSELGNSKTSISYHFKSKEALLEEAFSASCERINVEISAAAKSANGLECVLSLVRGRAENYAKFLSGAAPPPIILSDISHVNTIIPAELKLRFQAQIEGLVEFLKFGQNDGSVEITSTHASAFFILNILHRIPTWLADIPNARHGAAIDGLCNLLRYGLYVDRTRLPVKSGFQREQEAYPAIFNRAVKNRLKRDAFLRAGTRHLNRTGYRNLSLNDIAADLGVSRGAFYYYIADKDALIEACFDRSCDRIEKAFDMSKSSPGSDRLEDMERALRHLFEEHITGLNPLIRYNLLCALKPAKRVAFETRLKRLGSSISENIAAATVQGVARPVDINAAESILMGSIFAAGQWRLSATQLQRSWQPSAAPVAASAAYFEPVFKGLAKTAAVSP